MCLNLLHLLYVLILQSQSVLIWSSFHLEVLQFCRLKHAELNIYDFVLVISQYWHKGCFSCEVCKMALSMTNYKGFEKKPYCSMWVFTPNIAPWKWLKQQDGTWSRPHLQKSAQKWHHSITNIIDEDPVINFCINVIYGRTFHVPGANFYHQESSRSVPPSHV